MGPAIPQDLADRDVLPGIHLLDSGYVDADLLVTAQNRHQIDVIGPPFGSYSRQRREGAGYDLQAARHRQETTEFKARLHSAGGGGRSLSQGVRCFDLRRRRYLGLARTHVQQLLTATAMNVVRVIAWLWGEPLGERRRQPCHLARLSPHPSSRQTVLC